MNRLSGTNYIDHTGERFGRLTILEDSGKRVYAKKRVLWLCRCDCGGTKEVVYASLKKGCTVSCGCRLKEIQKLAPGKTCTTYKHGNATNLGLTRTYTTWTTMKARCKNPKATSYPWYGGRGISVCQRWIESFDNFLEDMGDRPKGMSLDRIDSGKNYNRENCRWATAKQQAQNRRPVAA